MQSCKLQSRDGLIVFMLGSRQSVQSNPFPAFGKGQKENLPRNWIEGPLYASGQCLLTRSLVTRNGGKNSPISAILQYRVFNHRHVQSKAFFRREIIGFHWTLLSHMNLHELHFHLVKQFQPCLNNKNFLFFLVKTEFFCVFQPFFKKLRHWVCWDLFGRPKNENKKMGQINIPKKLWKKKL